MAYIGPQVKDSYNISQDIAALWGRVNTIDSPVGSVLMSAGDDQQVPPGYLLMNGAPVTATYPDLRAFGLAAGWETDVNGDPLIPNMGGKFPRGWVPGQLVDSGRVFGTLQEDALQNITGWYRNQYGPRTAGAVTNGALFLDPNNQVSGQYDHAASGTMQALTFDASRVARTADETRPINETFTFWIKAYAAYTVPGAINLGELVNDVNNTSNRATALEELVGLGPIGVGQTWQAPARNANTTYQNTTGRPIMVAIVATQSTLRLIEVSADQSTWFTVGRAADGSAGTSFIVPDGWYYRINNTASITSWTELK